MSQKSNPQKRLLYEVSIIRPIVIFLLVFLHSFTKIAAGGGQVNDYQLAGTYQWLCYFISGFRIETIALVAGYVFSYQSHDLGRSYEFCPFLVKKFKRLIIPMLFFGLVYYFCFSFKPGSFDLSSFILDLLSGPGHLWFLPMLFWCFLVIWVIDRYNLSSWWTLFFFAGLSILPYHNLPLGLARLPHFVFYVYAGYFLWIKKDILLRHCLSFRWIVVAWVVYAIWVIVLHCYMPTYDSGMPYVRKGMFLLLSGTVKFLMSCSGLFALYLTVCNFTCKEEFRPKQWVIRASDVCYGVYVYHQFVLIALYFYTSLVETAHPLIVPWLGFVISLGISLLLTYITLKTKIGQFLIG